MEQVEFTAKWIRDLYRTEDFSVAMFEDPETGACYKCVGAMVPEIGNIKYDIKAEKSFDEKYKEDKYTIVSVTIARCHTKKDILDLLASGLFPGIGKGMAERIYKKFGDRSIDIIENHPEQLVSVKGISSNKISKIINSYKQHKAESEAYKYLAPFGFSLKQVHGIRKISPTDDILDFAKANPYALINIRGVSFDMADLVAADNLIPKDDLSRIEAAATQIIKNEMSHGHVGCEYLPVANGLIKLLKTKKVNPGNVGSFIVELIKRDKLGYRKIKDEDGRTVMFLYLMSALEAENELTDFIKKNVESNNTPDIKNVDAEIKKISLSYGVTLDQCQIDAIKMALNHNFSVITGGPGTGKTTIIKIITDIWEKTVKKGIVLMSPTGRAARRMTEATGRSAATIHSTLRFGIMEDTGVRNEMSEENVIEDSLVIIDECSMLDLFLARDMLKHLDNCTIVFVGDVDQLPSVGSGKVLEDIINSERVPVTRLMYSHRQDEGSSICDNAEKIKQGDYRLRADKDFSIFLSKNDTSFDHSLLEKLEDKMIAEYKKLLDIYGLENVAILCPFNKYPAGQLSINKKLQEYINPFNGSREFKSKNGTTFRTGDPVMQLVNEDDISNGDVGRVMTVDRVDGKDTLVVKYFDTLKSYDKDSAENLALAYAMTVHKSQGSEYDAIITCLTGSHGSMVKRNIIYTAITRAKKKVVFCGTEDALKAAILNDKTEERNTLLCHNLKEKIPAKDGKIVEFKKDKDYHQMRIVL